MNVALCLCRKIGCPADDCGAKEVRHLACAGTWGAAAMLMGPSVLLKLSCCASVVNQRTVLGI